MPKFSLDTIRSRRADIAKEKARSEAETPIDATPEGIRAAMHEARKFEIRAGSSLTTPEILADPKLGPLFKEYMKAAGREVDIDATELNEEQHEKMEEGRIEFLAITKQVEQVRAMITPKLLQGILNSGLVNKDLSFKDFANQIGKTDGKTGVTDTTVLLDIIHKQLLPLAFKEPDRFETIAESVELLAISVESDTGKQAKAAEKVLDKYRLSPDQYEKFKENVDHYNAGTMSDDEALEFERDLRKQVRSSKGVFGILQAGMDKSLEKLEAHQAKLEDDDKDTDQFLNDAWTYRNELTTTWLPQAKAESELHEDDETHSSHEEVRILQGNLASVDKKIKIAQKDKRRIGEWLRFVQLNVQHTEKLSSRGGARRIAESIPDTEKMLEIVDDHMQEIGTLLRATFHESSLLGNELQAARQDKNKSRPIAPLDEKSIGQQSPAYQEWQFDNYVTTARAGGITDTRESMRKPFTKAQRGGGMSFTSWWRKSSTIAF